MDVGKLIEAARAAASIQHDNLGDWCRFDPPHFAWDCPKECPGRLLREALAE